MIKEDWQIYAIAGFFLLIVILLLTILEKRLRKKAHITTIIGKHKAQIAELRKIKNSPHTSEKILNELDTVFRRIIHERRKIDKGAEYSEIIDKLGSNPHIKEFSDIMIKIKYSGQRITKEKIRRLASLLINILEHREKR